MKTLSLVMIVLNESDKLGRCLESVQGLVDEIVVVDTGSTDDSKQVAVNYGAKVYDFAWTQSFADARNFALSHATSDWNLSLDADEYISNDCRSAIEEFMNRDEPAIGRIKIVNKVMHQDGISYENSFTSRMFPSGLYYKGRIHEQIDSDLPRVKVGIEVHHDGYFETHKSGRNIPLLNMVLKENPDSPYYLYQLAKEYHGKGEHAEANQYYSMSYRRLSKKEIFAPNVIVDYLYSIVASGHLDVGMQLIQNEQQYLHDFPDFHFACGVFYLDYILGDVEKRAQLLHKIEFSYLRCIELGETDKYNSVIGTGSYAAHYNLGTYYEVIGNQTQAKSCYGKAAEYGYEPAIARLKQE